MQINVPCILYEGTLRSVFEVDKSQLQIFHALESDRHEIFQWLMSSDGKLSSDDNDKDHHEKISALWHNHVLTVLVDIRHKNLKEYADNKDGILEDILSTTLNNLAVVSSEYGVIKIYDLEIKFRTKEGKY